jgi:NAD(P)-dependent dehydrogenase (short-subunit alcohol dehydrogenase family)
MKQIAFITGANKGLGLEIARQLGKQNYTVVLGARDAKKGEEAVQKLKKDGIDAHTVEVNVENEAQIARLPAVFKERFGGLDVLVNNAGVGNWGDDSLKAVKNTFDVNFFGVVAVTEALLPLLQASKAGRIVNHSSVLGSLSTMEKDGSQYTGFIKVGYTASKAALNGYTVALAARLAGSDIKVNSAHPGWVKTDLGGDQAPMVVEDGAKTAVHLATLPATGPTGQFFHMRERLPW